MFPTRFFNLRSFARRFFPKFGADPGPDTNPPTGEISATGAENLIGGSMTIFQSLSACLTRVKTPFTSYSTPSVSAPTGR